MKVKEKREKLGLNLNIQQTKIMASGPITSCEIDGETVETVSDFILGGLQNHFPWKESYDQPRQHIKSRYITLPTIVHPVKAMVFSVVIYACES